jgi:hypothetical protein
MAVNIILGYIHNYGPSQCWNWVRSLELSGFSGDIVMLVGDCTKETVEWLRSRNIKVFGYEAPYGNFVNTLPHAAVVSRFYMANQFLNMNRGIYDWVMLSDVKDVIFQRNPADFWNDCSSSFNGEWIIAACEDLLYRDEPWGNENMKQSFPEAYNIMKREPIYNAGTLSGTVKIMEDFFLKVFLLCKHNPIHNPDQSAVNILLETYDPYYTDHSDPWACQLGTSMDPLKWDNFKKNFLADPPKYNPETGIVTTADDKPYVIVHQYDRIPILRDLINERYKENG